jgi:hypothetical protein
MNDAVAEQVQNPVAQPTPVSAGPREAPRPAPTAPSTSEYVKPSEPNLEIEEDLRNAGVVESRGEQSLGNGLEEVVQPAGPFVEPKREPSGKVSLLSDDEVKQVVKTESKRSSVRWLVELMKKVAKRLKGGEK